VNFKMRGLLIALFGFALVASLIAQTGTPSPSATTAVGAAQSGVQTSEAPKPQQLSEPTIKWIFSIGLACVSIAWVLIPMIFAYQGKLEEMLDLLRRGAVIRFVTITYIVLVIVILSLIGKLEGDKVATLLASIAGYVLGQSTPSDKVQGPTEGGNSASAGREA
jgi:hypothetical protein